MDFNGIRVFMGIFYFSILAFGNCFYILNSLQTDPEQPPIAGNNIAYAFLYTYSLTLGGGDTPFEQTDKQQWVLWMIFGQATFFCSIILLNMIIALMSDTNTQVMSTQKEARLQSKCNFMNEVGYFSMLLSHTSIFGSEPIPKYLIMASVNQEIEFIDSWNGTISNLYQFLSSKFEEDDQRQNFNFLQVKAMSQTISEQVQAQDLKISDVQALIFSIKDKYLAMESQKQINKSLKNTGQKIRSLLKKQ